MPAIAVIMATYNHAAYLAEAVESVLAQTFADWELVIVDDGSTDGTAAVLAQLAADHPGRFRVIRQANAGAGAAMNVGLAATTAPLVAFLDSDDTWTPDHLATLAPMLSFSPSPFQGEGRGEGGVGTDAGLNFTGLTLTRSPAATPLSLEGRGGRTILAFGRRDVMDEHGRVVDRPGKPFCTGRVTSELFRSMFISKICVLARRDAVEQAGRFDTALRMGEDYELLLRLSRLGDFVGTDKIVAHRRRHGANITADTPAYRVRTAALLERFYFKLDGWRDVAPAVARTRLAHAHYAAGKKLLWAGDGRAARFHLARAAAFEPPTLKARLLQCLASLAWPVCGRQASPALPSEYRFIDIDLAQRILDGKP